MTTPINDLDNTNIQIYGDDLDIVAVAPFGTTLPVGLADLTTPFVDVGWLSEDGIGWDDSMEVTDFKGHQGGKTVLKIPTSVSRTFKFQCEEETAVTLGLRYPGFTPAKVGETTAYGGEIPAPRMDPRAWVIDLGSITQDGVRKRYIVPKGVVTEVGTLEHKRAGITMYEFTVEALEGKVFLYSNAPAWAPAP